MTPRPNESVQRLEPYAWEALAAEVAAAAGIAEADVIRFDLNTTAWPPVAWQQTLDDLRELPVNEYPHPSNEPLRSALADHLDVGPDQVIVTSGADEALYLLARTYLGPGRRAVAVDPSFAMFRVATEAAGATLVTVAVDESWDLPLEAMLEALRDPAVGIAWLCNPNNPTGRDFVPGVLQAILDAAPHVVVAVDEAYSEISGSTLATPVLGSPNGALIRTFSKGYGLAGARVGYLAGPADLIGHAERVRPPQNLSAFGLAAAGRALRDQAGLLARVQAIVAERGRLEHELRRRGWELVPSRANFVLGRPPQPAAQVAAHLMAAGLVLRSFPAHPRLSSWLRVTVRAPHEDDRLLARLDTLGNFPADPL